VNEGGKVYLKDVKTRGENTTENREAMLSGAWLDNGESFFYDIRRHY
jgi:hypothetical protein